MSENPDVRTISQFVEHNGPTHHDYADVFNVELLPSGARVSFGRMRKDGSEIADMHTSILLVTPVAQVFVEKIAELHASLQPTRQ